MEYEVFYVLFISVNLGVTLVIMLAACLCCRKKIPKNEFLGLEGMVKIKNPEENIENAESSPQVLDITSSTTGDTDSKRASNAPHRSLPDIPVADSMNDNGSELYATVADKVHEKPQGRSPTPSIKKQTSVSQHSSISQADDVSSPYARVKTPPHDYDKVRPTEHPYAQLTTPGQSSSTYQPIVENSTDNGHSRRASNQSQLGELESQHEIPAASAIAGMVSASQELPYMTPPIVQQPHFSGDSQDSSKGYTSISVREPLANILAQTKRSRLMPKDGSDSHYATVSDDSDEMYAAIDDPNNHGDVYTSGSETYAQIQPANTTQPNPVVVSVDINPAASRLQENAEVALRATNTVKHTNETPIPPPVDSLRAQMHSRQASSSSNTSSVGILGSPKPEKRQANSPLPPTPKILQFNSNSNLTSTSSIPSGRNSVASVIECLLPQSGRNVSKENIAHELEEESSAKKNFSPSKDIEGMYAKVMKKTKLSSAPSQNSSPILTRKLSVETNTSDAAPGDLDIKEFVLNAIQASPGKNSVKSASYIENNYETIDKRRPRSNSYNNKDHGYETIPADKINGNNNLIGNRKSDGYAQVAQKERLRNELEQPLRVLNLDVQQSVTQFPTIDVCKIPYEPGYESLPDQSLTATDPGYETLLRTSAGDTLKPNSDYDPNYEMLQPGKYSGNSDDGYAKVGEKIQQNEDTVDGYSRVKEADELVPGYSTIAEKPHQSLTKKHHDYASIAEAKKLIQLSKPNSVNNNDEAGSDIYSSIPNEQTSPYLATPEDFHNYQPICDTKQTTITTPNNSACSKSSEKLTTPSTGHSSPDRLMKCSSTSNTISSSQHHSSSNYESLTGSESDPNYESVRYLDSENPYERLHSDSNISPDIPSSVHSPNNSERKNLVSHSPNQKPISSLPNSENNGEVDDYFQV